MNERTQTLPYQTYSNCRSRNYSWWVTEPEAHLKLAATNSNAHAQLPEKSSWKQNKYAKQAQIGKTKYKCMFSCNPKKREKIGSSMIWKHPVKTQLNLKGFLWQICSRKWIRTWGFIRNRGIRELLWVLVLLGTTRSNKFEKNATRPLRYAPLSSPKFFYYK